MNLADILAVVARSHPCARAISVFEPGTMGGVPSLSLSYADFLLAVRRLATGLQHRYGLPAGARVALVMENSADFFISLFAIWQAGLVAVPINAKLHAREVWWIANHADVRLIIASRALAGQLTVAESGAGGAPIIDTGSQDFRGLLDRDPAVAFQDRSRPTDHLGPAHDDAWIFYTSGTTGRPKGAILTHANLLFACHAYYADISFVDERSTMLHAAPLSHGSGLYGLAHFLRGSHNVIQHGFEPGDVLQAFGRFERVAMFAAPTMVYRLLADPKLNDIATDGLEALIYGGAPMYRANLDAALQRFGPRLFHLYGQGESPMTITGLSIRAHALRPDQLTTVGTARTGVAVRVVDDMGRDCALGALGEVVTRSACVMRGYLHDEAATARAIRDGWLWTGDVGHLDHEGYVTLADRSKDLIISGGTNIYPREIEEVLLMDAGVAECAVVGERHDDWGERVVAFIVTAPGAALDPDRLDRLCLARIARFKRPQRYIQVATLPKNNYGKVLKTALRDTLNTTAKPGSP